MAFLCPLRLRRSKKNKSGSNSDSDNEVLRRTNANGPVPGIGRITGSASIETLMRVGIEKENGLSADSKMVVLYDFTPCVDDELNVKRGQVVNILYRDNDWVYVIAEDSRQEGFIPHSYCTPYNSELGETALNDVKKKLLRPPAATPTESIVEVEMNEQQKHGNYGNLSDCESFGNKPQDQKNQYKQNIISSRASLPSTSSLAEIQPFFKDPAGRYFVLYTFVARDENDISVEKGELVTLLNREDLDWYWIIRSDGQEGFVPSSFLFPADIIQGHINQMNNNQCAGVTNTGTNIGLPPVVTRAQPHRNSNVKDIDPATHGTEMVMLYDYKAQGPDDLSVKRGEVINADLNNQMVDGWLWTYSPKTKKYGFIPRAYAQSQANITSL